MNNLVVEAYSALFPNRAEHRKFEIVYSAKFKPFNANVKYNSSKITFSLSKNWLEFSEDLRKGLIQHLFIKVINHAYVSTFELDLYHKFISNLSNYAKVDKSDPELLESFNRVNKEYFNNDISAPNLVWGASSFRKLGHYEYTSDTILISSVLKKEIDLLDYVVFHELLHKKLGFKKTARGRFAHHSKEFKLEESKFKIKDIEKRLRFFLRKKKLVKSLSFF